MGGKLADNIRGLRKARGFTQERLAEALGVTVGAATAALDRQTAQQVMDAILGLDGMTRVVVTHALEEELLGRYDRILVLRDGRVAEEGSFRELMERKGYFYSLYTVSQAA